MDEGRIIFADQVTTVPPNYAREIQTWRMALARRRAARDRIQIQRT
jgi:glycogen synthase